MQIIRMIKFIYVKHITIVFLLILSVNVYSQDRKELYTYDEPITCEMLQNGIYDYKLYQYVNSKLYVKPEGLRENTIYKLMVDNKIFYITSEVKLKIDKLLKEKNCNGVSIAPVDTKKTTKVKKVTD